VILIGRVLATIALVNIFVLAVFVGLATLQYDSILSGLIRERLVVLADTVRAPFQAVADLGVSIETVRNADAVLERARISDASILAIHVISPEGEIVHTTSSLVQEHAQADILDAARTAGATATWHLETSDSFLVGANILGANGAEAGSAVIEYSKHGANIQVQAMEARLVLLAGIVLAVTLLGGLFVLRFVLSEHLRIFDGILSSFDRFERIFWRGLKSENDQEINVSGLGLNTSDFQDLLERSEEQYQVAKLGQRTTETTATTR
jgi:hypothetical protein